MKFLGKNINLITLFVMVAVFSTVTPLRVSAEDVSQITNIVYSSQSTGGTSNRGSDGQDGEDGMDGKPGEDGRPGTAGGSSINIDSTGSASISIESTVDGVKVIDIEQIHDLSGNESSIVVIEAASSSVTTETASSVSSSIAAPIGSPYSFSTLQDVFLSLRSIILKYVSNLL